jgi:hypothetical protein
MRGGDTALEHTGAATDPFGPVDVATLFADGPHHPARRRVPDLDQRPVRHRLPRLRRPRTHHRGDVPASLAFAGFTVFVKGGPGPTDYAAWELDSGEPVSRQLGREPGRVDLLYCHRPFGELPGIVALARRLGAQAFWWQTGLTSGGGKDPSACWVSPQESRQARELAAAAGLAYIDDVYLADAARARYSA